MDARIKTSTLSDGSETYDVEFTLFSFDGKGAKVLMPCADRDGAERLLTALEDLAQEAHVA